MSAAARKRIYNSALIILIAAVVIFSVFVYFRDRNEFKNAVDGRLQIHFIDVGQGDCALIISPGGENLLIDAGGEDSSEKVISYIRRLGVERIDHMMLSHLHEDHIGSADDIAREIGVRKVYTATDGSDEGLLFPVFSVFEECGATHVPVSSGYELILTGGVDIELRLPEKTGSGDKNDDSMIIKMTFGGTSFLFTGDAEESEERELTGKYGKALSCDLLKVAHHGSATSSTEEFLEAASPSVAVISCGKNNEYGHPGAKTLERLKKVGAEVLRTDIDGSIVILSDGEYIMRYEGKVYG